MRTNLLLATLLASTLFAGGALADDWTVTRLRGAVLHQVDGAWLPLGRNDVVPDDRRIKTTNNGYVTLARGDETLELGPSTQIRIIDEGGRKPYTTVVQSWGTVAVEAEVRNVEHFAVTNRYLAAVVKGTRFVVGATSAGGSVDVERGRVSVGSPEGSATVVSAGQAANVKEGGTIEVSGDGVLPVVTSASNRSAVADAAADLAAANASGDAAAIAAAKQALRDATGKADDKAAAEAARAAEKAAREQAKADEAARRAAEKAARDAENNRGGNSDNSGKPDDPGKGKSDDPPGNGENNDGRDNGKNSDTAGNGKNNDNQGKGGGKGPG